MQQGWAQNKAWVGNTGGEPPSAASLLGTDEEPAKDKVGSSQQGVQEDPLQGLHIPPKETIDDTKWQGLIFQQQASLREDECIEDLKKFFEKHFLPGEFKQLRDSNKDLAQDIYYKSWKVMLCPKNSTVVSIANAIAAWEVLEMSTWFSFFGDWKEFLLEKRTKEPTKKSPITKVN